MSEIGWTSVPADLRILVENFPLCEDPESLFTTEDFRLLSHVTSAVALPINMFGIYCIVFKSSVKMQGFKQHLLVYQIWTTVNDFTLSFLVTPSMYFPAIAGCSVGILTNLGVPMRIQTWLGHVPLFGLGPAIISLFAYRHQLIVPPTSFLKIHKRRTKSAIIVAMYAVYCNTLTIPLLIHPTDQIRAQVDICVEFKCIPPGFFTSGVEVLESRDQAQLFLVTFTSSLLAVIVLSLVILAHCIWTLSNATQVSPRTKRLQRQYVYYLYLQVLLPFTMIAIPAMVLAGVAWLGVYNQSRLVLIAKLFTKINPESKRIGVLQSG